MRNEASEISRLEQSNILGLAFVRTIILLNGGGILALLTYLGNASSQTAVSIPLATIKCGMFSFLAGITFILVSLLISYSFTASAPETKYSQFFDRWIIPTNSGFALCSLVAFVFGVAILLFGAQIT